MKRKVSGTNLLPKPKVFLQSPQIHSPTLPSQNLQIPSTQRVIHPTSVEKKQIVQTVNHIPKVTPRSEVNITHLSQHLQFTIPPTTRFSRDTHVYI